MTPTEKLEMQIAESDDGSATVQLPENIESPQQQETLPNNENETQSASHDSDDVDDEREQIRAARREERRLKKQIHREKARESNHLINAYKKTK